MVFYEAPKNYDPENILPLDSINKWFEYCLENKNYILALLGENGDPEFEKRFKEKVCLEINKMMNDECMPNDELRSYCVELVFSIHFSLMNFALKVEKDGIKTGLGPKELTKLSNYWRAFAIAEEREKGICQTLKK